eukprot:CAMPEP_0179081654 /NCGR_PEP_ID=MMETSP0796-20121207/36776_1 /TAXON_ID=73915 /ORGANISM="Pyrodinium bahamense, Strain pbaha01" /LENGTH=361 /DNA_ID=CAMNT_0020779041 /DNA_START=24 /DNA_END=1109 /DNA_ORIENTATION=-
MGVCNGKPEPDAAEVVAPVQPVQDPPITVAIINARGVRSTDWFLGLLPEHFIYCTLSVKGQDVELHKTKLAKDTLSPFWKEEAVIRGVQAGDALDFTVWDAEPGCRGDKLGSAVLEPERFRERGFNGELQLTGSGESTPSFLRIKVKLDGQPYPRGPLKEFRVQIDNPSNLPLGMDVDVTDGNTLYIIAVREGLAQQYNQEAPYDQQIRAGDFVVKVNDTEGSSTKLREALKEETFLELLIKRPMEFDVAVKAEADQEPRGGFCAPGGSDHSHGLNFIKKPSGTSIVVDKIAEGPVKAWNEENPAQEVRVGDRIVAVNGKKEKIADLKKKLKAAKFHMTMVRPAEPEPKVIAVEANGGNGW